MTPITPTQNTSFLYRLKKNEKKPLNPKLPSVANQALSSTTCSVNPPLAQNKEPSVVKKLSSERINIISEVLKKPSQTKEKSTSLPRSPTTCLNSECSIGEQEKVLGPDLLSAIVNTKNALKCKTESPPTPTPLRRRVFFQTTEQLPAEKPTVLPRSSSTPPSPPPKKNKPKHISANTPTAAPTKGILKQPSKEKELELAMAELNRVLTDLGIDPV